jgi:allantoate deiminase
MEQGPVLEALHYPLGVVKGIAGQTRLKVHRSSLLFL